MNKKERLKQDKQLYKQMLLEERKVIQNLIKDKIINNDFERNYFGHYEHIKQAKNEYHKLLKTKKVDSEFDDIYFGRYASPEAFAYYRLCSYDKNGNPVEGCCYSYKEYTNELFSKNFIYADGHVFQR